MRKLCLALGTGLLAACTIEEGYFPAEITYDCLQGQYFILNYPDADNVSVKYLNEIRILERWRISSGVKYRDVDGTAYLFIKGDEAVLEWDSIRLEGCQVRE